MKRLIILSDLDDVLNDQGRLWFQRLNETHGYNVKYDDVTEWDVSKFYPNLNKSELYAPVLNSELTNYMSPNEESVQITNEWHNRGHTIIITTSTSTCNIDVKAKWLKKHYDWFTDNNLILTHKKQLIQGDVLIDDGIHNMLPDEETGINGKYIKLCFDKPWNRDFDCEANGIVRVRSFSEIDKIIKELER